MVFCPDDHHRLWKKHFWKIFTKILKKILAIIFQDVYYIKCCDVIAVKREVAAWEKSPAGYSAERMSSYNTDDKSLYHYSLPQGRNDVWPEEPGPRFLTR